MAPQWAPAPPAAAVPPPPPLPPTPVLDGIRAQQLAAAAPPMPFGYAPAHGMYAPGTYTYAAPPPGLQAPFPFTPDEPGARHNPANFKALPLAWMRSVPAAGTRSKRRDNLW